VSGNSFRDVGVDFENEEFAMWVSAIKTICPFFTSLAMFAEHEFTDDIPTAATDGKRLLFNPRFMGSLTNRERLGVFIHELLHAALLHTSRKKDKSPIVWNVAADIVVNNIILEYNKLDLPEGALVDSSFVDLSVEEVYELLIDQYTESEVKEQLDQSVIGEDISITENNGSQIDINDTAGLLADKLETYWREAHLQSASLANLGNVKFGALSAGLKRSIDQIICPTLDWRTILWRYLVQTPVDFSGLDRRFVGDGLYLDNFEGESLNVTICVDSSGSVDKKLFSSFYEEIYAILNSYPHINASLFFADASLYGPYEICSESISLFETQARGGGGTSFRPLFDLLLESKKNTQLVVYLTDGYGSFPNEEPTEEVLWVVAPGGLRDSEFPFGEVSRMVD